MSKEKQIDEIAKLICPYSQCTYYNIIGACVDCECRIADKSEEVYNAGYRKQEWISVEDGEPEEATNVLCIENDNYYLAFLEDGVWFDCVSYYRDDTFTQVFPTHWMPLPEAPKMKGGAE